MEDLGSSMQDLGMWVKGLGYFGFRVESLGLRV